MSLLAGLWQYTDRPAVYIPATKDAGPRVISGHNLATLTDYLKQQGIETELTTLHEIFKAQDSVAFDQRNGTLTFV
jgi:hypothetical protein